MRSTPRFVSRSWLLVMALVGLTACTETTAPALRYPVLDDVGLADWTSVTVGADHTCGLTTSGTAYCWGSNQYGQLGFSVVDTLCGAQQARYACSLAPRAVQADLKFASLSAGGHHTCGITTNRDAYCWGANESGETGDVGVASPTPVKVTTGLPWAQISAGFSHTCGIRTDGALFCWGGNDRGQLGNGTSINSAALVRVNLPAPAAMVSTGQSRTCARTTTGSVYCWGAVWIGRQDGLEITRAQMTPAVVPQSPNMSYLTVGSFTTCGTDASGMAYCWEANPRGGLGNGTLDGSTSPERVLSDQSFLQLSAGIAQTCGISITGAGYCWGDNSFGQLGVSPSSLIERCANGTLPCSTRPVEVIGRQQFTQLATGFGSHTCGVTTVGNLYCWGLGVSGQRGDGTESVGVFTPALVAERKLSN